MNAKKNHNFVEFFRFVYRKRNHSSEATDSDMVHASSILHRNDSQPGSAQPMIHLQTPCRSAQHVEISSRFNNQPETPPQTDYNLGAFALKHYDPSAMQSLAVPGTHKHQLPRRLPSTGSTKSDTEREFICHHSVSAPFHHQDNMTPNKGSQAGVKAASYTRRSVTSESSDAMMVCKDLRGPAVIVDPHHRYLSDSSDPPVSGTYILNRDIGPSAILEVDNTDQTCASDAFPSYSEQTERSLATMQTVIVKENDHYVVRPLLTSDATEPNQQRAENSIEVRWRNETVDPGLTARRVVAFEDPEVDVDRSSPAISPEVCEGRLETEAMDPIEPNLLGVTNSRYRFSDRPLDKSNNSIVEAEDEESQYYEPVYTRCDSCSDDLNFNTVYDEVCNKNSESAVIYPTSSHQINRLVRSQSNPWNAQPIMCKVGPHPALLGEMNISSNAGEWTDCRLCAQGEIHICGVSVSQSGNRSVKQ